MVRSGQVYDGDGYLNNWGADVTPEVEALFHASPGEIARAAAVREGKLLRKALRAHRHTLQRSILEGDESTARKLLRVPSVLLECRTRDGVTPLGLAASVGNTAILGMLLELGADVSASDHTGASPLMMAALKGHGDVIGMLLGSKQGGSLGKDYLLRHTTKHGETAVIAAAKAGHVEVLELLANAGAETGVSCVCAGSGGVDALMMACRHDRITAIQWLLQRGLSPQRRDGAGRDALMHASSCGSKQAVDYLLQQAAAQGPDVTALDASGYGALHHACLGGDPAVVEKLAAQGAAPGSLQALESPNSDGDALLAAAASAGHSRVVELLLKNKVGTGRLLLDGDAHPLFAAVRGGRDSHRFVVEALLAAGSRIDPKDDRGRTPLGVAAARGDADMVELLVANGASMLSLDNHGRVPRQIAARLQRAPTAQMLSDMARVRYVAPEDTPPEAGLADAWGGPLDRWPRQQSGAPGGLAHAPAGRSAEVAAREGRERLGWGHNAGNIRYRDTPAWQSKLPARVLKPQLASSGKNGFRSRAADVVWLPSTV